MPSNPIISTTNNTDDTYTFNFDGGKYSAVVPPGAISVVFHIWGGGGGGGGGDSAGPGRAGAAGHYVTGTMNLTAAAGQALALGVGGGAAGKNNGRGLTGYSGGVGGTQGASGSSGSGGGGGGATVIQLAAADVAIAGGGGGGGGDGQFSVGTVGINNNDPTLASPGPGTLGENGADHSGDGAGAGAGGGGADGGRSGNGPGGDEGATGGYSGSNLVPAGGTADNGSGTTPGGSASGYLTSGVATGGGGGSLAGGNGKAVLIFNSNAKIKFKQDTTITNVSSSFTTGASIVNYFNDTIGENPTNSTAWWVVTPNLLWPELIGTSDLYNDSIAIDQNDETLYSGSNNTDTTITIGSTTYTRGSLAASTTATFTLASGTYTHTFQAYNYTITEATGWYNIKDIYFRTPNNDPDLRWKRILKAFVKIGGAWKAIFSKGLNFQYTTAGFGDATGNPSSGTPGSGGTGGGGGCKIICTKLHELGYLSDEIYQADEMFGHWLRQTDPNAYYGYLKWARVVVDWMSNEGPQCMFWIQDKKIRNERQREMATRWAIRIATPWAQHMAYKMGVLKEDSRAGRYIMTIGVAVSRLIGRFVKHTNQPTKNVAIGYAMWAMFGLLYMIAGVK